MRAIGFMVCGPGEADRYLEGSLKEFARLCDDVLIACNNTDEKTEQLIREYGFSFYRDDREWGRFQPNIKTKLLKTIGRTLQPDWILPLDADEQYGTMFNRVDVEQFADTEALAFYFYIVNLWNDENHYRKNISFWNIRAFKYDRKWGENYLQRNVHCGLAPPYAYRYGRHAGHLVRHYGLMERKDRLNKVERYEKYDPNRDKVGIGGWYDALASDTSGSEFIEADVQAKVEDEVRRMNQNLNKKFMGKRAEERVYVYLRDRSSGREFEVPKSKLNKYIKRCDVIGEVEVPYTDRSEAPVIEKREAVRNEDKKTVETRAGMQCDKCEFATLSKGGLTRHKNAKHGKSKGDVQEAKVSALSNKPE